jgi:hypothetical protein
MQVIKPNTENQEQEYKTAIFLAGSIEMGLAENWQGIVERFLQNKPVTIFNPRRDDWDSSWKQEKNNPQFNQQVNWELDKLAQADIIFMYFERNTKSPISLLELGAYSDKNVIVCCPDGFWRKGNVDIFCERKDIPVYNNFSEGLTTLLTKIAIKYDN